MPDRRAPAHASRGRGATDKGRKGRGRAGRHQHDHENIIGEQHDDGSDKSDPDVGIMVIGDTNVDDPDQHHDSSQSDINDAESETEVPMSQPEGVNTSGFAQPRKTRDVPPKPTASEAASSSRPSASTHKHIERGSRGPPSSVFNPTTVWAGNVAVVRREDTPVLASIQRQIGAST